MSRFSAGKSAIKLDAAGNIDTAQLEAELRSALEFDVKYKQTDNMKKKAVKVSGSYDEFKARVACAHLKTLSSKEVQSLAAPKRGWQKSHVATDLAKSTMTLQQEQQLQQQREFEPASIGGATLGAEGAGAGAESKIITVAPNLTFPRPKTASALERDLQSACLASPEQRLSYLSQLGPRRVQKLLGKGDAGCDVLELVLATVMHGAETEAEAGAGVGAQSAATAGKEGGGEPSADPASGEKQSASGVDEAAAAAAAAASLTAQQRVEWLGALSGMERFSVSLHFVSAPLLGRVQAWLASAAPSPTGEGLVEKYRR